MPSADATTARLAAITYRFPEHEARSGELFMALMTLLARVPGVVVDGAVLRLVPRQPVGALPITAFALAAVAIPEIVFATPLPFDLTIGALRVCGAGGESVAVRPPVRIVGPLAAAGPVLRQRRCRERVGHRGVVGAGGRIR